MYVSQQEARSTSMDITSDIMSDAQVQQGGKPPLLNIVGEKVALGPAHHDLLPLLNKWDNNFATFFLGGNVLRPVTEGGTEAFLAATLQGESQGIFFIIYEYASLRPIGWTNLRRIDAKNGTGEFGILIGEEDCRGKGYGTEVTRLMLDYGFTVANLHNIVLDTASHNERAIRAYTRAGFRIIGRRRQVLRWGNKRYDSVLMDCLSTEFETPLKRILTLP
jgi:RimJ/RimL family protein N-acetyltransferase